MGSYQAGFVRVNKGQGRFEIVCELGQGGQGRVWLAVDRVNARQVVLKVASQGDEAALADEFRRLAALDHPAIVQVLDIFRDRDSGELILVEEHVEGSTLGERLGDLDDDEIRTLATQMLDALRHLRALGIRHGDLKPANIMIRGRGRELELRLVDFGFADAIAARRLRGGTPAFFAPEMSRGEGSRGADLWAFGQTLAALELGRLPPFAAGELRSLKEKDPLLEILLAEDVARRLEVFSRRELVEGLEAALPERLPFVGRSAEMARLERELVAALEGNAAPMRSLTVSPGLGATRLVEEVMRAFPPDLAPTFFRAVWFDLETLIREVAARIGAGFDLEIPSAAGVDQQATLLWGQLTRLDCSIVIGFGRQASRSSAAEALRALVERQDGDRPRLVLVDVRDAEQEDSELAPLELAEVEEILERSFPVVHDLDPDVLAGIAEQAQAIVEGSPELLDLLLRRALAGGALDCSRGSLIVDRAGLASVDLTRGELPDDAFERRILAAFSANLGFLDREALLELLDITADRLERALLRLKRAGYLREAGRQGAALGYQGPRLDGPGWALTRSGADPVAAMVRLEVWFARGSHRAVVVHAERILEDSPELPQERAALAFLAARARAALSEFDEALDLCARIRKSSGRHVSETERVLLEATCLSARGRVDEALTVLEAALENELDRDDEARLRSEAAYVSFLAGRPGSALAFAESAVELATSHATLGRAAVMAGSARRQSGELELALAHFERALEAFARMGDERRRAAVLANRAMVLLDQGQSLRANADLEEARRLFQNCGSIDQLAATQLNLGVVRQRLHDFDAAISVQAEAERLFLLVGDERRALAARASQAISLLDQGRFVAAHRLLLRVLRRSKSIDLGAVRERLALERLRADFLGGRKGRARRRLASLDRARLDAAGRERVETLEALLGSDFALDRLRDDRDELARRLRSRDLLLRIEATAAATLHHLGAARTDAAARHFRRLKTILKGLEIDMTERELERHVEGFAHPLLDDLMERIEASLEGGDGGALVSIRKTMSRVQSSNSLGESMVAVAEGVLELGRALRVYVVSWDGRKASLVAEARRDHSRDATPELSTMILKRVAAADEAIVVADASHDDVMGFAASVQALGLRSVACFPLIMGGEQKLMLYLDTPLESGAFDQTQRKTLETFAVMARIACSLHDRALRSEERSRRADLEVEHVRGDLKSKTLEVERLRERSGFGLLVGTSKEMERLRRAIGDLGPTELSVLITGETGSGKELIAQALHRESARSSGPFIAINCANLNSTLMASELFGHQKGAFTGAVADREGVFQAARGGTLFLDEVGELEIGLQAKLLRVLEERKLRPVGSDRVQDVDVRVVAATNQAVRDPAVFRPDLFFRLAQAEIRAIPLRERAADIAGLVDHFRATRAPSLPPLESEALAALCDYDWPGNVRQLFNVLERARIMAQGSEVLLTDLPQEIWDFSGRQPPTLAEVEAEALRAALRFTGGEKKAAAELLGISRTALYEKLKRLGPDFA